MRNQEKQTLERENRVFGGIEVFRIGFKTLFYKARSEMAVLPPISNFWPVGTILCRSAQYCAGVTFMQPVASRWPPSPAGGVPTALFRPCEQFWVFIVQESARKCIPDAQPASVLTSDRVFCAWHPDSSKDCILLYPLSFTRFKSCPVCFAYITRVV